MKMMKMGTLSRSLWEALGVKGKPPVFLKKVMGKYPRRRSKSEEKKRRWWKYRRDRSYPLARSTDWRKSRALTLEDW